MTALSINLNKISLLRNSREGNYPNIVKHAKVCIEHGADGITVHPRPDQRHIRPKDVRDLAELVRPQPNLEFNVEGNPFAPALADYPGFLELVEETNPDQCTLVPDTDSQLTSDHGFDLHSSGEALYPIIQRLKNEGMRVSLFMDPDLEQIDLAAKVGEDRIELYTEAYALLYPKDKEQSIAPYREAAILANKIGLGINAGHDLSLENISFFAREIPGLLEVSIGHALMSESLYLGFETVVQRYLSYLSK